MTDTFTLERYIKTGRDGTRELEPSVNIACRKVLRSEVISFTEREEIKSKMTIWTKTMIGDKDVVDGLDVKDLMEYKSLYDHSVKGYRVKV